MKIIVVGCGKIGTVIISSLVAEGHDVVAIDTDPEVLASATNIHDIMGVCGNGVNIKTLEEAGAGKAELFAAVTGSDETNMLSCLMAEKLGAAHTIARVRNPEYNTSLDFIRKELELSMIVNPDRLAAEELFNILQLPTAVKIETFSRRNFEMIELKLKENSALAGIKLSELRNRYDAKFLVCAVSRGDKIFIPDGNFVLEAGDKIGLTASPAEIEKLLRSIGVLQKQAKSVMILGGSRSAFYLAQKLSSLGTSVKIIEQDKELCEELSELLPKAFIINGDGAQQELLLEEGIRSTDAFVALTGMDEENILISFFAGSQNVPKVISKVNREELASLAENLGLDCIVSPKKIISDILVRYARALQNSIGSSVETLYKLMDGKAEALEFSVTADSNVINIPLSKLETKPNIIIAGIIRDREPIIPSGDDIILPGDRVVVIAADRRLKDLSDIVK